MAMHRKTARARGALAWRRPKTHLKSSRASPSGQWRPERSKSCSAVTAMATTTQSACHQPFSVRMRCGDMRRDRNRRRERVVAKVAERCSKSWRTTSRGSLMAGAGGVCTQASALTDTAALHSTRGASSALKPLRMRGLTNHTPVSHTEERSPSVLMESSATSMSGSVDARSPRDVPRSMMTPVTIMKGVATRRLKTSMRPTSSVSTPYWRAQTYTVGAGGMHP
mmetsp:Transcript_27475/g.73947  ORF Transcript_27475/g.73947 Transcript_27475/m.73947 type:complete len:224 (-) Transcript_27475:917-1588(-)